MNMQGKVAEDELTTPLRGVKRERPADKWYYVVNVCQSAVVIEAVGLVGVSVKNRKNECRRG